MIKIFSFDRGCLEDFSCEAKVKSSRPSRKMAKLSIKKVFMVLDLIKTTYITRAYKWYCFSASERKKNLACCAQTQRSTF